MKQNGKQCVTSNVSVAVSSKCLKRLSSQCGEELRKRNVAQIARDFMRNFVPDGHQRFVTFRHHIGNVILTLCINVKQMVVLSIQALKSKRKRTKERRRPVDRETIVGRHFNYGRRKTLMPAW